MANKYMRLKRDLLKFHNDPPQGIHLYVDESNLNNIHALIIGPKSTPYEGGFFYFTMAIPSDYPHSPPVVKFKTTGNGAVRFNPNLYNCGKVCLSILGTWAGPGWTPIMSISTVLISIQSLLNDEPYYNEPGFEKTTNKTQSDQYNMAVMRNNIIYAVGNMLDRSTNMPDKLFAIAKQHFLENFIFYIDICHTHSDISAQITRLEAIQNTLLSQ